MYIKLHRYKSVFYLLVNDKGQYEFTSKELATNFKSYNQFRYVMDDVSVLFPNDFFSIEVN